VPFEVLITAAEELTADRIRTPAELVTRNAQRKAHAATLAAPGRLVLAADTVVALGDAVLGKPADADEAVAMLQRLSGRTHEVVTGLCLRCNNREVTDHVATLVSFASLSDELIAAYVATGEPLDKAGAYGIQGRGSVLVERLDGCYFNVVGLPLARLSGLLLEFGVSVGDCWHQPPLPPVHNDFIPNSTCSTDTGACES